MPDADTNSGKKPIGVRRYDPETLMGDRLSRRGTDAKEEENKHTFQSHEERAESQSRSEQGKD